MMQPVGNTTQSQAHGFMDTLNFMGTQVSNLAKKVSLILSLNYLYFSAIAGQDEIALETKDHFIKEMIETIQTIQKKDVSKLDHKIRKTFLRISGAIWKFFLFLSGNDLNNYPNLVQKNFKEITEEDFFQYYTMGSKSSIQPVNLDAALHHND
jgi:hypothetical protein